MKNITLSMPDDLLRKSREYAEKHGTSLNQFIRDLLKLTVLSDNERDLKSVFDKMDQDDVKKNEKWNREELYER